MWSMVLLKATLLGWILLGTIQTTWSASSSPSNPALAQSLEKAAYLSKEGRSADARKIYESLLPALRQEAPSDQLGFVLNALSKIVGNGGSYDEAISLAQQSTDVYVRLGNISGQAHALNNKAIAEVEKGDYPAARNDLTQALALARLGNDEENQTQILNNIGSAYYFPGIYSEAQQSYDQAMKIIARNSRSSWSDYWRQITSVNQATLLQRLGHSEKALQIYRQVESSSKSLTPGDRAHLYANIGTLYRRLGDPYKALDTYLAAQSLYSREHDADGELAVLKNIGIVHALDMQDLRGAISIFKRALILAQLSHNRREEMQSHLYLAETLLRSYSLDQARTEFMQAHSFADQLNTSEEQWKSLYGLGRIENLSGNPALAESELRQSIAIIEESRSQLQLTALKTDFFADKRDAYDTLLALLFQKRETSQAFDLLERSRARSFQDRVQSRDPQFAKSPLSLDQARSALDPATLLLEYWVAPQQVGLIWSTRETSGMTLKQISPAEEASIHDILGALPGSLVHAPQQEMAVLNTLFPDSTVLPPGIRHVLIVPDGWISYVPFDLLRPPGSSQQLIEQYDITYIPTAALLLRARKLDRRLRFPWTHELVAFGDPVSESSNLSTISGDSNESDLQTLPYAETEIRSIVELLPGSSQLFLKRDDLKTTFLNGRANSALLLHVSTHAFADVDNPENSRLLFSPATNTGPADYVFLRELYEMDLSHVELATISACDSERGKLSRGEGVQAFSRAVLSAGASSALTALWRVDDRPTAEFMKQFYYFALRPRTSKAEALRLAKLKFLRSDSKLSDPRIWATFVLSGDGAAPLPAVISWKAIVMTTVLLAGLVLAFAAVLLGRGRWINRKQEA